MCRHRLVWYGTWCCRLNSAFGSATIMTDDLNSPPKKRGTAPLNFRAMPHVCCGQTAGCIRIPLGTEVGLGPGDIVLDGAPAPP